LKKKNNNFKSLGMLLLGFESAYVAPLPLDNLKKRGRKFTATTL